MADTIMNLEPITLPGIENKRPLVIAGPCSAETEDQVLETAKELAAQGIKYSVPEYGNPVPNRVGSRA